MSEIPRWGIHNQIKYSPRRSIVKECKNPKCKRLFLQYNRGNVDIVAMSVHKYKKRTNANKK
jgi:hypothetical protein